MKLFKVVMEYIKKQHNETEGKKMTIGKIEFVERKGAIYARVYDTEGKLLKESDDWLTSSLDSMNFTRETKRCIKVWGPDNALKATLAKGTLAPYWDAAQAAEK